MCGQVIDHALSRMAKLYYSPVFGTDSNDPADRTAIDQSVGQRRGLKKISLRYG